MEQGRREIERTDSHREVAATLDDDEIVALWLRSIDGKDQTIKTYADGLRPWRAHLAEEGVGIMAATRDDVLEYRAELAEDFKVSTINSYMTSVRSLYGFLEDAGAKLDITRGVKGMRRHSDSPRDALTPEQAARLLEGISGDRAVDLRDRAMVDLMLRRGLRCCEVSRANVEDMRPVSGTMVLFVQGKGFDDRDTFVVMPSPCVNEALDYLAARGGHLQGDAPLFASEGNRNHGGRLTPQSVSHIVKARMRAAGIDDPALTAHSLRHTAVTYALQGGAPLDEVQTMARHADPKTTRIYAHNIRKLEDRAGRACDGVLDEALHSREEGRGGDDE